MHFYRKKKRYLVLPLSLLLLISICLSSLTGCLPKSKATSGDAAFKQFTTNLFQQEVSSNSISLHYTLQNPKKYGILDAPITYGGYSTDEKLSRLTLENCLAALDQYNYSSLSKENRLTYDVLKSYLKTALKGADYLLYDEPLSPLTGIQAQLPVLLSEYQFQNTSDADTYLSLMAETPDYFQSLSDFEQKKANQGLFMSDSAADSIIAECRTFIDMGANNYLYSTFEERLGTLDGLSDEQKQSYLSQNQQLISDCIFPAYENLIQTLSRLKGSGTNENGLCALPKGKSYYEYVVERETGSEKNVSDLQKATRAQIAKDLGDMQSILGGSAKDAKETAAQDMEALGTSEPSLILNNLEHQIENTFPEAPKVDTQIKYVPDVMQEYLSPAFYMIPAIDNTNNNVIYINQGRTMKGIELFTTLAHEGYPGHLYQTTYYAQKDPDPLRSILGFGGYVEGWATYAEMCSYYLAPLEKKQATLLQKNTSVILGLYALADMGIHYDGWTLTDTISFFREYGIENTDAIKSIFSLIISDPANYLKYYIGYIEFLELKEKAVNQWGDDFTQKKFHKAVLDVGPAPFSIVEKYALLKSGS